MRPSLVAARHLDPPANAEVARDVILLLTSLNRHTQVPRGADVDRTRYIDVANVALYQLSYNPIVLLFSITLTFQDNQILFYNRTLAVLSEDTSNV